MWTREGLKSNAKEVLKKHYWYLFLATIITGFLSGGGIGFSYNFNFSSIFNLFNTNNYNNNFDYYNPNISGFDSQTFFAALIIGLIVFSIIFIIVLAFSYAYKIFVINPFEVGRNKYFLNAREDKANLEDIIYSFKNRRYKNVVKAMAWRDLFIFLWTLLFTIPGIVKGYAYSMVPYLLTDNPNMSYGRALKLSMDMTRGEKGDIFVLDLSFIGWYLLGLMACGIGIIFVTPYYFATKAELYLALRHKALQQGLCSYEELGFTRPNTNTIEN